MKICYYPYCIGLSELILFDLEIIMRMLSIKQSLLTENGKISEFIIFVVVLLMLAS